ncbi:MAG: hypothetical protein JWO76_2738 [Nocardioides sp.]|nr:hypothetical protein [Nocardioides sp.]
MSLDIEVRGDPAACRDTARRLNRLASVVDEASDGLARQAHLSDHDFGGLSGDVFRDHTGRLAAAGDRSSRRCARLARALDELALDLEDVRALMELAQQAARPWLAVDAATIRPPTMDPRPADPWVTQAWSAWHRAALLVDRARAVEHRAQHDWRTALWQFAGGTPAATPWDLDDVTDGDWPDADGVPAYHPDLGPHLVTASHASPPPREPHHAVPIAGTPAGTSAASSQSAAPAGAAGHGPGRKWGYGTVATWHAAAAHLTGNGQQPMACGTSPVGELLGQPGEPTPPAVPAPPEVPVGPPTCGTSPVPAPSPPPSPPTCGTSPVPEVLRATG